MYTCCVTLTKTYFLCPPKRYKKKIQKSKFLILITTISIEKLSSPIENIFQVD